MEKHAEKLLNKAQKRLIMMPREENILLSSKRAIQVMEEALNELKEYILSYNFKDDDEEIRFFKQIKPQFLSLLLYHNKVYNLELIRPIESKEMQKQYLRTELDRLRNFFERNKEFCKYNRISATKFDDHYFLRGKAKDSLSHDSFYFECDPKFSTGYDYKLAKIIANESLSVYINNQLDELNGDIFSPKVKLTWTGKKSELIGLIYALYESGSFNNSQTTIKELTDYFESVFNVDLKDSYRTFNEIKNRKGNRTLFLSNLIISLNDRMDKTDCK